MHTIHQLTVLSACVALECRRSKKGKGEEGEQCINHCVLGEHAIDRLGSVVIVGLVISVEFMFFFHCRYNGEVGDVVVGRITEVRRNLQCKRLASNFIE